MTAPVTSTVDMLEEAFSDDVMCGGNNFPTPSPCPHSRVAVLRNQSLCKCPNSQSSKAFKCAECYAVFIEARIRSNAGVTRLICKTCRATINAANAPASWPVKYVPL